MSKDDYPVTYRMLILKDGVVLKLGFANGTHDELVMSMAEAETLGAQITAAAKHRRKAQGVLGEVAGEKAAREAEAKRLLDLCDSSPLREHPDREWADRWLIRAYQAAWGPLG